MPALDPRNRILETASRLFYEQGYLATGINQVIAEAGVAKATFYAHFPAKEDLAVAYLRGKAKAWNAACDAATSGLVDPVDRLFSLFDFAEAFVADTGLRGCAFLNMAAEFPDAASPPRRFIAEFKAALHDRVRALVVDALPQHPAEADKRASGVFLLLEAAIAEAPAVRDLWPVRVARDAAETLLTAPV